MATKTASLSKEQALSAIYDFFKQFQTWLSTEKVPTQAEVEKFLSPHFKITSNGRIVGRSAADYLVRIKKFQEKYSRFEISKPLEEPVISGNEIAIYYRVDLTPRRGGATKQVYIMAFGTIEDHRMATWTQVAHEQGTGDWDK
jgi:hypothetical protein